MSHCKGVGSWCVMSSACANIQNLLCTRPSWDPSYMPKMKLAWTLRPLSCHSAQTLSTSAPVLLHVNTYKKHSMRSHTTFNAPIFSPNRRACIFLTMTIPLELDWSPWVAMTERSQRSSWPTWSVAYCFCKYLDTTRVLHAAEISTSQSCECHSVVQGTEVDVCLPLLPVRPTLPQSLFRSPSYHLRSEHFVSH